MPLKSTPVKYCKYCGKKLERKRQPSGDLECLFHFNKRQYCDIECSKRSFLKADDSKQTWTPAHHTARKINELILKKDSCELCGSTKSLDVHHKDFNESNNNLDNLQVLCRSCHMKLHRPKPTCQVPNCNRPVKGYGYCEKHYQRWEKYGDPLITNRGHGNYVKELGNGTYVPITQSEIPKKLN